jgi:ADP-ribose pyrophosphatase
MPQRLIDKQVIYDGRKVRLEVHHLEDEDTGKRSRREVCVHPGAVVVLPFLPDGRVLLIRNRRYTVGLTLIELPAGTLERNEDPINCAGRELLEETGYVAGRLRAINHFFASPGILTERLYAYAAYDLERGRAAPEEDEEITLLPAAWDDVMEMIRLNEIQDGKTIATLLTYDKFHRGGAGL